MLFIQLNDFKKIARDRRDFKFFFSGVVWWVNKANHFESVWFHRNKVFKYGYNLHNKRLEECLKEGDAVHLIVEKAPANLGAKWSAKQILVTDESTSELRQIFKPNEK